MRKTAAAAMASTPPSITVTRAPYACASAPAARLPKGPSPTTVMAADYLQSFFRLFGDSNGDATVNITDYNAFLSTFGKASGNGAYKAWFDFDASASVNVADYNALLARFGKGYSF